MKVATSRFPRRFGTELGGRLDRARADRLIVLLRGFLPPSYRPELVHLYRFCRAVFAMAQRSPSVDEARHALWAARDGLPVGYAAFSGIEHYFRLQEIRPMPVDPALAFLDGVLLDLSPVRIRTEAELIHYGYQAASTLVMLFWHAVDSASPPALAYAIDLGIAVRLSEIARDVAQDAHRNRIYLPAEWIEPTAVIRAANGNRLEQERVYAVILRLLAVAEIYYRSSEYGIRNLPWWARHGVLAAAQCHEAIGTAIRRANLDYWKPLRSGSAGRLVRGTFTAAASVTFLPRFRRIGETKPHCAALHSAIVCLYGANRARPTSFHLEYGTRS